MPDIHVIFILPEKCKDESEASTIMKDAFKLCKDTVNNISWQKESELDLRNLTKLNYIVFENFDTHDFSDIIKTKSAVLGPQAISVCLSENKSIPSFQWPILNVIMYDCVITATHLSKIHKESIKNKVQLMGGSYTGDFLGNVTHLICDGSTSEKYLFGAEKGVKLMLPSWIDYLWQEGQQKRINTNDPELLDKFKCPTFHKQIICTTGISSRSEKAKLQELITANGGEMVGKLNLNQTHVLICHGTEGTTSEKFKAAKSRSIPCVTIDWLFNSVEKGYSLSYKNYQVKATTSTPTKDSENMNPNFSSISSIGRLSGIQKSHIDETITSSMSNDKKRKAPEDLVGKIDMKRVKGAGNFLDGCSIFVAGFNLEQHEKLNKAINLSGATRYDILSDRVTHVIVGNPCCSEIQAALNKKLVCTFVSVQWLLDSIEQQRPAKEEEYTICNIKEKESTKTNISSPVNRKALDILRKNKLTVESVEKQSNTNKEITVDDILTQQYLGNITNIEKQDTFNKLLEGVVFPENKTLTEPEFTVKTKTLKSAHISLQSDNEYSVQLQPQESSSQVTTDVSANVSIFCSYIFVVANFDEEATEVIEEHIEVSGGTVIKNLSGSTIDYLVIPILKKNRSPLKVFAKEIVNELFILESLDKGSLVNISYYHKPIYVPTNSPLKDCVVTISAYTGQERLFLKTVIEGLGGVFQEQFSRKNIPNKNVLASTHLVLPTAGGKKYEAAIKWKLPVINKDWLLKCAMSGSKVNINDFLVDKNYSTFENVSNEDNSSLSRADQSDKTKDFEECRTGTELTDSNISTPVSIKTDNNNMKTPLNQIYHNIGQQTPETYSQVTPLNKILQDAIANKILPTPSPKTYYPWDPKTPDTPIGAFIRENPSPALRKEMQKYVNSFPEFVPPTRRLSTPLSELRKRLRNKVLYGDECNANYQEEKAVSIHTAESPFSKFCENNGINEEDGIGLLLEDHVDTDEKLKVNQKLQQLQDMVMASGSGSSSRRPSRLFEIVQNCESPSAEATIQTNTETNSQVCTVDWDYGQRETETQMPKVFLLSGIELNQREHISKHIKTLGGIVSESASYDNSCTHLICPKPLRNEKTLACMAAGKWILHVSYIEKSEKAGRFLSEEHFEFGNHLSRSNINYDEKDHCINFWRKEIKKRGYGAFNGMRAIVIAERREPLIKVIEAGEGVVLNILPPFEDSVHATHCLLEAKVIKDLSQYTPLALQGIKCVNTIYINEFLRNCGKDVTNYVLPYFSSYYSKEK